MADVGISNEHVPKPANMTRDLKGVKLLDNSVNKNIFTHIVLRKNRGKSIVLVI